MTRGVNSSLRKVIDARENTHWGRYDLDGVPIRSIGPLPPIKNEEYDHAFVDTKDWHFGMFNMDDPTHTQHGLTLEAVMDACLAGAFTRITHKLFEHQAADGTLKLSMYVEWVENYKELSPRFARNVNPTNYGSSNADPLIS